MRPFSRALESLTSALFLVLAAPPLAGATFGLTVALLSKGSNEIPDTSISSLLLLAVGLATGAYYIGAIPAFLAGLALPYLMRRDSNSLAAIKCGVLGASAYLLTFGAHLIGPSFAIQSIVTYIIPAFVGTALASYAFSRRRTEV
jgi:hypothetical protein